MTERPPAVEDDGSRRLRVCQVLLGEAFGGGERLFVDLSIELRARDVEVLAVCRPGTRMFTALEAAGVPLLGMRESGSRDLVCAWRLRRAIRRFGADLVHTHLSRATRIVTIARSRVPVVTSIHNYGRWRYYRLADYYMPITELGEEHVRARGVADARIHPTRNFTRLPLRHEPKEAPRRPVRLLAYGRFVVEKGFQDLLRACDRLRAEELDFELTLAGAGQYEDELRELVASLGLQWHVRMPGWLEDVGSSLDAADLFVLPSRHEPFGIVLLEAMARRVPIITTASEGPAEFLSETAAFFAAVADPIGLAGAIARAVREPATARDKAVHAFELCRARYTAEVVVADVIEQYCVIRQSQRR